MGRTCLFGIGALLIGFSVGCAMCGHPHDYCGPTCTGDGSLGCHMCGRAGSIIEPYGDPVGTPAETQAEKQEWQEAGKKVEWSEEPTLKPTPAVPPQTRPAPETQPTPRPAAQSQKQAFRSVPVRTSSILPTQQ